MMNPESVGILRRILRSFKRSASRLRDGSRLLGEAEPVRFSMNWAEGQDLQGSFDEAQPLVRYAALLRPFMAPASPLELLGVWKTLSADPGLVDGATRETIAEAITAADNLDVNVVLDGKTLTARDLYFAYAEGKFFDADDEAKKLLEHVSVGPMQQMVPFLFYGACVSYSKLVFAMLEVILSIERRHPDLSFPRAAEPQCIYCLTRDGDFGPEEHVIPEAFGLDDLVLRDAVCRACNNEFSKLDQFLANFEPLALLRVLNVSLTKKGKFPSADFRDFELEKVKPRELRFVNKTKREVFISEDLPDGSVRLSFSIAARKPLDVASLARALFKIGLGLVAYDHGPEYACGSRFHAARDFIRGRGGMPNHLLISHRVNPTPTINTAWQSSDAATVVDLDVFGMRFAFNLEPSPFGVAHEAPAGLFNQFWLNTKTKGGAILPCPNECGHS